MKPRDTIHHAVDSVQVMFVPIWSSYDMCHHLAIVLLHCLLHTLQQFPIPKSPTGNNLRRASICNSPGYGKVLDKPHVVVLIYGTKDHLFSLVLLILLIG